MFLNTERKYLEADYNVTSVRKKLNFYSMEMVKLDPNKQFIRSDTEIITRGQFCSHSPRLVCYERIFLEWLCGWGFLLACLLFFLYFFKERGLAYNLLIVNVFDPQNKN